ncbi:GDP-mannose 4,6-dehydratase [Methylophaga thalassica]|uniref:GDP-mannose 4,6-dehydratase n=1 Tax=Methylophaga aminisulfidivorans TaxID=230105 RepID=UPI0024E1CC1C|nr:GDP-mannose 4,6-dehydratase [Methylophaga aminisulfidivorans]
MKKVALVTGVTGQDGIYLANLLNEKGYEVFGATRNKDTTVLDEEVAAQLNDVHIVDWNLRDKNDIRKLLERTQPAEVYNLAAFTSGEGMFSEPDIMGDVNGLGVVRILESIKQFNPRIKFCQASSREVFGVPSEEPQDEMTLINPRSPYGAAKAYADMMIKIYREHYNLFACSAILFNHESPFRGQHFVTRKITQTAAKIKLGLEHRLVLGNLDARRDWGFAGDYMLAMWKMLQNDVAEDFIVATGTVHTVRDACKYAFDFLGLDYRDFVDDSNTEFFRPAESVELVGNASKLQTELSWKPLVDFRSTIEMMVEHDFQLLKNRNIQE